MLPRVSCHSQFVNKGQPTIRMNKFILTQTLQNFWNFLFRFFWKWSRIWFQGTWPKIQNSIFCKTRVTIFCFSAEKAFFFDVFKWISINLNCEFHNFTICEMKQYTGVPWNWKSKTGQFQIKFRKNGLNY